MSRGGGTLKSPDESRPWLLLQGDCLPEGDWSSWRIISWVNSDGLAWRAGKRESRVAGLAHPVVPVLDAAGVFNRELRADGDVDRVISNEVAAAALVELRYG